MAKLSLTADDVLLATKKKVVPASDERRVSIPGYATPEGRKVTLKLAVSDEGSAELDRMVSAAEKTIADIDADVDRRKREAWKPLLDLVEARDRAAAAQQEKFNAASKKADSQPEPSQNQAPSGHEGASEHQG